MLPKFKFLSNRPLTQSLLPKKLSMGLGYLYDDIFAYHHFLGLAFWLMINETIHLSIFFGLSIPFIFLVICLSIFEMVAMPLPCNGFLLCCVNIPTVLLMFFNKFASFRLSDVQITTYNHHKITKANIMSSNMIHQRKRKKRKLALTNFINQLGHFGTM